MLKVLELFAGIGACSKALTNLGIDHEIVDAVEIDKYAIKSFNAVHGTDFEAQDITKWDKDLDVDLILHGSPCQDFSAAGLQAGGDKGSGTRSSLMYETLRIVEKLKPKYVIWENVKNLLSKKHIHNFEAYQEAMKNLGYVNYYKVLNAKDYGVPQNRERVFTVSIREDVNKQFSFPEKMPLKKRLKDILDDDVDEKYYLSEERLDTIQKWEQRQKDNGRGFRFNLLDGESVGKAVTTSGDRPSVTNYVIIEDSVKPSVAKNIERESEKIATTEKDIYQCECTSGWADNRIGCKISPTIRANNNCLYGLTANKHIRKLTPKECWRLMGFSDEDFEKAAKVNSNTQLYKQAGNSIVVDVLYSIFKELL